MSGHHCHRCGSSLHPGAMKCSGCMAGVVYGATANELRRAAKIGAGAVLAVWCYVVAYSLPAVVVGCTAALVSGVLLRKISGRARAHMVRTVTDQRARIV